MSLAVVVSSLGRCPLRCMGDVGQSDWPHRLMVRTCVFCGETPLTREQVFPKWLRDILPHQERWRGQGVAVLDGRLIDERELPVATREMGQGFTDTIVARVCASCNGGWMSALEREVKPLLSALVRGERLAIDGGAAASLALWVAKTTAMAELTHPESAALSADDVRGLMKARLPPSYLNIWMVPSGGGPDWALRWQHFAVLWGDPLTTDPEEQPNTFSTTIGLNRVAFCVMGTRNPILPLPDLDGIPPLHSARIWPQSRSLHFARERNLSDRELWVLSDLLHLWLSDDDEAFESSLVELALRAGTPGLG